jgi:hypothetical protein
VERVLDEKARVGLTTGFMFLKGEGTPAKAIYFEEALVEKLEWIHKKHFRNHPINYQLVGGIWGKEIHAERGNNGGSERWH